MATNQASAQASETQLPQFDFASARRDMRRARSRAGNMAAAVPIIFIATTQSISAQPAKDPVFEPLQSDMRLLNGELSDRLKDRIADLEAMGAEEDLVLASGAAQQLYAFVERFEVGNRPQITLRDDGALRVLFASKHAELSMVLDGSNQVKTALVVARKDGSVGKWGGIDCVDGIVDMLHGFNIAGSLLG
jgi:hypothetical protein